MANALIDLIRRTFRLAGSPELAEYGPTRAAETRTVLEKMALVGPNDRPSLTKQVRCYDTSTPQYYPEDSTLADLDPDTMCLNTVITVDWGPDGYGQKYRVTYDEQGPLQVFIDGRFIGYKVNASLVLVGSEADVVTGVEEFDPQNELGYRGPDEAGKNASLVREVVVATGVTDFYTALQDMDLADFPDGFPSPSTGPAGFWKKASPPTPAYQSYQVLSRENMLLVMGDEAVSENKLYGVVAAQGLVLVQGLTRRHVSYEAWLYADEAQPVRGTYDLVDDEFTAGAGDGPSSFTAAALEALMHPNSQIVLEEVEGLVYGSLAAGSVRPVHLSAEMQARLNPELLRVTAAGGQATVYRTTDTLAAALAGPAPGSVVELQVPAGLSQLVVQNAVRYVFGAAATMPAVLTDNGQAVHAYIEFAQQYTGARRIEATHAGTQLRVYGGLSGEGEPAILATAGTVEHTGQSYGKLAEIGGAVRLNKYGRHICGGDTGIKAAGTSIAHLYGHIVAGYERGAELSGSAQLHIHGDSAQTFGNWPLAYFAYVADSAQLHLYAGRHTSLTRPYATLQNAAAEIHLHPGAELPTPGGGLTIEGTGKVYLYAPNQLDEATIDSRCTIIRLGGAGASGATELQIRSDSANRIFTIDATAPISLLAVSAIAARNASGATFQVNKYVAGAWVGGTERNTLQDAQADLAALTAAERANGAELLVKTIPINAANISRLILTLQHG